MEKKYINDEIFYVDNFLSPSTHQFLINLCDSVQWSFEDKNVPYRGKVDLYGNEYDFIWEEFRTNLFKLFDEKDYDHNYTRTLQKFKHGFPDGDDKYVMGLHSDDDGYKKYKQIHSPVPEVLYGAVYYINSNYDGGEVEYPYLGLKVKPKSNTLLCHPGTILYTHGVTKVSNFDRLSIPSFMFNANSQFQKLVRDTEDHH